MDNMNDGAMPAGEMECPVCHEKTADKEAMMAHWEEKHPGMPMPAEAGETPAAEEAAVDATPAADEPAVDEPAAM